MSGFKDTSAEKLKEGDVVILASGGRVWTLDSITVDFYTQNPRYRLVSMSVNGLLSEVVVNRSSIRLATREEREFVTNRGPRR